ncbi:MAG TPA: glycine C-acetyltransferase [Candidatus Limnocylindria bacterium]|nr:glycine C-acetyltransferase [Candidatus Limnocylindria bacterium]
MNEATRDALAAQIRSIRESGLLKQERVITTPQGPSIRLASGQEVVNFCANNYLGLSAHPAVLQAAHAALERWGYGMSSVRFICGTQEIHRDLEARLTDFLGTEDTILYGSCFDANGGLFEVLLGENDAVLSDALNHASIIDGVRLSKAKRLRYAHNDMDELEAKLREVSSSGVTMIATDGVFSMDGAVANLPAICRLADRYGALVMVDDSHGVGVLGASGRGSHEAQGVLGRIDVLTGTLGKALGGASGGYTSGRREIVELLRQRSRPYLFSNTLAPMIAATSITVLDLIKRAADLRERLFSNTRRFRSAMTERRFRITPGDHPIVPVMLGDAKLAAAMAERLLHENIYVVAFSYPVVPHGTARIRVQLSASHTTEQIDASVAAFEKVGRQLAAV